MKAITYFTGARIIPTTNISIVIHFISPISILNFKLRAKIPIIEAYVIESEHFSGVAQMSDINPLKSFFIRKRV